MTIFVQTIAEDDATGPVADFYRQQRSTWGFLPNHARVFSSRPDVAQAWAALNGAIRGNMDRRLFELATVAAARALRSTYCTAAHSRFLREASGDDTVLSAIADDPSGRALGPQDCAVFEFAAKVAIDAVSITQEDVDRLHAHGLTDLDITNIVFAAAARCSFTRVLDGLGAQLDVEIADSFSPALLASMIVGRPVHPA